MVRGLDGYFYLSTHTWPVQFSSSTERLAKFRWCIAKGRHLFPFRTEQLSLSAPMVLGGQPPGRVGRRRFFFAARALMGRGLRLSMDCAWKRSHRAPFGCGLLDLRSGAPRALGQPLGAPRCAGAGASGVAGRQAVVKTIGTSPPRPRTRSGGRTTGAGLAARRSSPNGLKPVLAERGEVDHQVDGVGQSSR